MCVDGFLPAIAREGLIRRGKDLRLHQFHRLAAALRLPVPGFDAQHLGAAGLALEPFA